MGDLKAQVGRNIGRAMTAKGWTQRRLAQELGVADAQINRWVHGRTMPTPGNLERLADTLDVSVDYFFRDDDDLVA